MAVSHICKENIFLRLKLNPFNSFVIPNAVDSNKFYPKTWREYERNGFDVIRIAFIARLEYRKGIDLLIDVIPPIC